MDNETKKIYDKTMSNMFKDRYDKIIREIFLKHGFHFTRMISSSKSRYRKAHPDNEITFNARAYLKKVYEDNKDGDIKGFFTGQDLECWYGDIDFTKDEKELKLVAKEIGTSIVFTTEHGQFVKEIKG